MTRVGDEVRRPWSDFTPSAHHFLRAVREAGFKGVPRPLPTQEDGRERLSFVPGDVPIPPYPPWAQTDEALASLATLMRQFHDAAGTVMAEGGWNGELADPQGGPIICHNDVCLENVVFRNGSAIAFLDWDFAAPGRPVYDLAQMARMCVPVDDDVSASRLGWVKANTPARLRLVSDAYGLAGEARMELLSVLDGVPDRPGGVPERVRGRDDAARAARQGREARRGPHAAVLRRRGGELVARRVRGGGAGRVARLRADEPRGLRP